jgi:hypothetical protein
MGVSSRHLDFHLGLTLDESSEPCHLMCAVSIVEVPPPLQGGCKP